MIDDFEETVSRYLTSFRAAANEQPNVAGYWKGRADEYAAQNAVDRRRAFRVARQRHAAETPQGAAA